MRVDDPAEVTTVDPTGGPRSGKTLCCQGNAARLGQRDLLDRHEPSSRSWPAAAATAILVLSHRQNAPCTVGDRDERGGMLHATREAAMRVTTRSRLAVLAAADADAGLHAPERPRRSDQPHRQPPQRSAAGAWHRAATPPAGRRRPPTRPTRSGYWPTYHGDNTRVGVDTDQPAARQDRRGVAQGARRCGVRVAADRGQQRHRRDREQHRLRPAQRSRRLVAPPGHAGAGPRCPAATSTRSASPAPRRTTRAAASSTSPPSWPGRSGTPCTRSTPSPARCCGTRGSTSRAWTRGRSSSAAP